MGGTLFEQVEYGTSVKEVFNNLVEDALHEYGHDGYNGSISTTGLGSEINLKNYPKLEKAFKKKNWGVIEDHSEILYSEKRNSDYIKELSHYEAFTPVWVNAKDTVTRKKGVTTEKKFVIMRESALNNRPFYLPTYQTLSEAKKAAKEESLKSNENVYIFQCRSDKSKVQIGYFNLTSDGKQYKSQRASKTKVYLPVYKFTFFVFAAC